MMPKGPVVTHSASAARAAPARCPVRWAGISMLLALGLLSGCALPRMIDSEVQSFSTRVAAVSPASYRFERLPSQESRDQDALEAIAAEALRKVGLNRAPLAATAMAASGAVADAASARYSVNVSLQIVRMDAPYAASTGTEWGRFGFGRRERSWLALSLEPQWLRHSVRVVLRESATAQVAFETEAHFDGPWADSAQLLPAILDAALQGYPNPPQGLRKVVVELPAAPARVP